MKSYAIPTFILALATAAAHADDPSQRKLTPLELYYRCYSQMVQIPPALTDPNVAALSANPGATAADAINACMAVLSYANLDLTTFKVAAGTHQAEGFAVLRAFDEFHHSWFPNDEMKVSLPSGGTFVWTRAELDEGEMGLHVTRALFAPGAGYADVVTGPESMNALRSNGPVTPVLYGPPGATSPGQPLPSIFSVTLWGVQTGLLQGVQPISSDPNRNNLVLPQSTPQVHITKSGGGGVLGAMAYLSLNLGRDLSQTMNGGLAMPRRWAKAVYSDLLCKNLPVLRQSDDVVGLRMVQPSNVAPTAITPPFRLNAQCMACHGTIDAMAATVRNVRYLSDNHDNAIHLQSYVATAAAETATKPNWADADGYVYVDSDSTYYLRPTKGRLRFRSYDGTLPLISVPVSSVAELGSRIAETNDYYACATARYFQFFTGIAVNLQDSGAPDFALGYTDLHYRNQVIALSQKWMSYIPSGFTSPPKRVQDLIRMILSDPLYQTQSMRYRGPIGGP